MSITAALTTIVDENVRRIVQHPPLVLRIIAPDDFEAYQEAAAWASRPRGLWSRWFGRRVRSDLSELVVPDVALEPGDNRICFLDKAWHGVHFLLAGSPDRGPEPLCFLMHGGQIGKLDLMGDQTVRLLTSDEIASFDDALSRVSTEVFKSRFDAKAMMKANVYPGIWDRDSAVEDFLAWLVGYFEKLKSFVHEARRTNKGMIIEIG